MSPVAETPELLDSFDLAGIKLPNRVVMAPMTRARAGKSRIPNELMGEYYAQRASAGLIISEATSISEQALGWNESPGIYSDEMVAGWKQVVAAVHQAGGRIFLQLWHCGRASHSDFHGGELAVAPSAIAIQGDDIHTPLGKKPHETPRALESDEIPGIVESYRLAAERARHAEFDGIEVHSANGYLLDQFLQSKTNTRTDAYGGNVAKRFRLLGEVVEAVSSVWQANRVGVRLSPNGAFNDMGSPDYREQCTHAATQLGALGLAYLHVMDGLGFGFHQLGSPITLDEVRRVFPDPVMGNVDYAPQSAAEAIAQGHADLIAFGRPYISNPDLVARFANGWPLAADAEMSAWYTPMGARGYTDFPAYSAADTIWRSPLGPVGGRGGGAVVLLGAGPGGEVG